jgi:hypothetical protein
MKCMGKYGEIMGSYGKIMGIIWENHGEIMGK